MSTNVQDLSRFPYERECLTEIVDYRCLPRSVCDDDRDDITGLLALIKAYRDLEIFHDEHFFGKKVSDLLDNLVEILVETRYVYNLINPLVKLSAQNSEELDDARAKGFQRTECFCRDWIKFIEEEIECRVKRYVILFKKIRSCQDQILSCL